ncbi:thermonuclease family protein [Pelagibacteraceae bacterium]|nr:thermonuclease family protein [Pelagibacteraceae bacterium]
MKKITLGMFGFLIFSLISFSHSYSTTSPKYITGKAKVIDGDTIKIDGVSIRLFGIDAPEKNQLCVKKNNTYNCGTISTKILKQYAGKEKIKCSYTQKDRYGRIIGICYFSYNNSKLSLNRYMVQTGHAVAYKRYSEKYLDSEKWARNNRLGIWQGQFERPEKWRRKN